MPGTVPHRPRRARSLPAAGPGRTPHRRGRAGTSGPEDPVVFGAWCAMRPLSGGLLVLAPSRRAVRVARRRGCRARGRWSCRGHGRRCRRAARRTSGGRRLTRSAMAWQRCARARGRSGRALTARGTPALGLERGIFSSSGPLGTSRFGTVRSTPRRERDAGPGGHPDSDQHEKNQQPGAGCRTDSTQHASAATAGVDEHRIRDGHVGDSRATPPWSDEMRHTN